MSIQSEVSTPADVPPAVLRAGFRPFFLLAGLEAMLMVPSWLVLWLGGHTLDLTYAATLWHGHEMLFGFVSAAIAGFLLTAVPNWTGPGPCGASRWRPWSSFGSLPVSPSILAACYRHGWPAWPPSAFCLAWGYAWRDRW